MRIVKKLTLEELDQITNERNSLFGGGGTVEQPNSTAKSKMVAPSCKDVGDVGITGRVYI